MPDSVDTTARVEAASAPGGYTAQDRSQLGAAAQGLVGQARASDATTARDLLSPSERVRGIETGAGNLASATSAPARGKDPRSPHARRSARPASSGIARGRAARAASGASALAAGAISRAASLSGSDDIGEGLARQMGSDALAGGKKAAKASGKAARVGWKKAAAGRYRWASRKAARTTIRRGARAVGKAAANAARAVAKAVAAGVKAAASAMGGPVGIGAAAVVVVLLLVALLVMVLSSSTASSAATAGVVGPVEYDPDAAWTVSNRNTCYGPFTADDPAGTGGEGMAWGEGSIDRTTWGVAKLKGGDFFDLPAGTIVEVATTIPVRGADGESEYRACRVVICDWGNGGSDVRDLDFQYAPANYLSGSTGDLKESCFSPVKYRIISVGDGKTVSRETLTALIGTSSGSDVVSVAKTKLGCRYVYGASGPDTFDCSGLVMWAYRQVGVSLPRTSREQYSATSRLTKAQLQPGDLVFFSSDGTAAGIHHVGIWVGDGKFIHAPSTGDVVKITSLSDSSYYKSQFLSGGRVSR